MARHILLPVAIFLGVSIVLAALGLWIYSRYFDTPATIPPPVTSTAEPSVTTAPPPPPPPPILEIPPLDASDELVRTLAKQVFHHPQVAAWVVPDDLVRRFVAAVDDVARGISPRTNLEHLAPKADFATDWSAGDLVIDDSSYQRYDLFTEVFTSMNTAKALDLYRELEPLCDQAYHDLGYPEGRFRRTVLRAIDRILEAPVVEDDVPLKRRVTHFKLADPELEALDPVQKHLLRMGPENTRKVQAKLQLLRQLLITGLPPE